MNVGQILETHLGWAAKGLGKRIGDLLDAQAKAADVRKALTLVYNSSGASEDIDALTEVEVLELAAQPAAGRAVRHAGVRRCHGSRRSRPCSIWRACPAAGR